MGFFSGRSDDQDKDEESLPPFSFIDESTRVSPHDPAALPSAFHETTSSVSLPPLTKERIIEALKEDESTYFVDSDGDIGWLIDGGIFYFFCLGKEAEILQVRGMWNRSVAMDYLPKILTFCNTWNTDMLWPKVYARVRDDGSIHINTEVSTDLEHGVSDQQLLRFIRNGLGSGNQVFIELSKLLPDPFAPGEK